MRTADGLPETLEEYTAPTSLRFLKIKNWRAISRRDARA